MEPSVDHSGAHQDFLIQELSRKILAQVQCVATLKNSLEKHPPSFTPSLEELKHLQLEIETIRCELERTAVQFSEGLSSERPDHSRPADFQAGSDVRSRKFKVLVVEPDLDNSRQIVQILTQNGYLLMLAGQSLQTQRLAEAEVPDLIVMNAAALKDDGFQAIRKLRAQAKTAQIPLILMTRHSLETEIFRSNPHCPNVKLCLEKPFSAQKLLSAARMVLYACAETQGLR